MIRANVIASTHEGYNASVTEQYTLGGKIAGECYLNGEYKDPKISSDVAGYNRANNTANNGHHSVFDHVTKSLELSGIPKMMVMILNSLGMYTTSEKSGRYTVMSPDTQEEQDIYDKWVNRFTSIITEKYPDMLAPEDATDKEKKMAYNSVVKLAQENARYLISIFTPTSMIYTASLRQWNYIRRWLLNMIEALGETEAQSPEAQFNWKLMQSCKEMVRIIEEHSYQDNIKDIKNRKIDFMSYQVNSETASIDKEYYGDTYTAIYKGSFVQLAQSQRHRVNKHIMKFNGVSTEFYVPAIIKNTEYEKEWLEDMAKVANNIPQGTLVTIVERGNTEDFILKLQERLCGRAQFEIMEQTKITLNKMLESNEISQDIYNKLKEYKGSNGDILARCAVGFKCTEGCRWGASKGLDREI